MSVEEIWRQGSRALSKLMFSSSSKKSLKESQKDLAIVGGSKSNSKALFKPLMASYLGRLEDRLRGEGVTCQVFLMHSGGGIISITDAAEFPVRLVESGPAGGAGTRARRSP